MINGDDVGLGKTFEAIAHFSYVKTREPDARALVFTERNALLQWKSSVAKFTTGLRAEVITADSHPDKLSRLKALRQCTADILITTYSLAYDYKDYLIEGRGKNFVLYADEPNYFKNPGTKLHERISVISNHSTRSYGLTATVLENRLEEIMGILHGLSPGACMSIYQFHKDHCYRVKVRKGVWITKSYKHLDVFRQRVEPWFYGRVQTNPEVKQALPEVVTKDVEIELGIEQSWKVVEAMDKLLQTPEGDVKKLQILQALTISQQLVNDPKLLDYDISSAKMEALTEMLTNSLDGHSTIVYSRFRTQ